MEFILLIVCSQCNHQSIDSPEKREINHIRINRSTKKNKHKDSVEIKPTLTIVVNDNKNNTIKISIKDAIFVQVIERNLLSASVDLNY